MRGKSMWGYVTGVRVKPTDEKTTDDANLVDLWETENAKIITWINNSVTHSIGALLAKYETAKEVWDHLERIYTQSNFAKQYQLESDIRALRHNQMSIHEFYSAMSSLWDQLALTESSALRVFAPYIARQEEQRLVQFFMALCDDFEGLRGAILHRSPLPSVDYVVNDLLAEEIRLKSKIDKEPPSPTPPSVFVVPQRSSSGHMSKSGVQVSQDECAFCKKKGN